MSWLDRRQPSNVGASASGEAAHPETRLTEQSRSTRRVAFAAVLGTGRDPLFPRGSGRHGYSRTKVLRSMGQITLDVQPAWLVARRTTEVLHWGTSGGNGTSASSVRACPSSSRPMHPDIREGRVSLRAGATALVCGPIPDRPCLRAASVSSDRPSCRTRRRSGPSHPGPRSSPRSVAPTGTETLASDHVSAYDANATDRLGRDRRISPIRAPCTSTCSGRGRAGRRAGWGRCRPPSPCARTPSGWPCR